MEFVEDVETVPTYLVSCKCPDPYNRIDPYFKLGIYGQAEGIWNKSVVAYFHSIRCAKSQEDLRSMAP